MRALGQYLIINEIKEDIKKTQGGLLLAEKQRDDIRYRRATLESIGDAIDTLEPGQVVWFDRAAGHNIEFGNGDVRKVIKLGDVVIVE